MRRDKGIAPRSRPRTANGLETAGARLHRRRPNQVWVTDFTMDAAGPGCYVASSSTCRPTDRGLARGHDQEDRPGDDSAADGAVAARPGGSPDRARAADPSLRCRQPIHLDPVHRTPRAGRIGLDRQRRRRVRQRLMETINGCTRPSATAPRIHNGTYKSSPISSTRPPAGSTGTTTDGSKEQSGWSQE